MSYGILDNVIINRLKNTRRNNNHSQEDVSRITKLSVVTISRIERGFYGGLQSRTIERLYKYFEEYEVEGLINPVTYTDTYKGNYNKKLEKKYKSKTSEKKTVTDNPKESYLWDYIDEFLKERGLTRKIVTDFTNTYDKQCYEMFALYKKGVFDKNVFKAIIKKLDKEFINDLTQCINRG